jgi:hypothetical protein
MERKGKAGLKDNMERPSNVCPACSSPIPKSWGNDGIHGTDVWNRHVEEVLVLGLSGDVLEVTCAICGAHLICVASNTDLSLGQFKWRKFDESN